eukprot:1362474-Rhodomonas_salina.1
MLGSRGQGWAHARFEAVRAETVRLTRTVRDLTAQVRLHSRAVAPALLGAGSRADGLGAWVRWSGSRCESRRTRRC